MAFFNTISPSYKQASSPNAKMYAPSAQSSGLASVFGSLFGDTTPVYKTRDGQAGRAPASSGLMRIFVGTPPSYRTVESAGASLTDEEPAVEEVENAEDASAPPTDTIVLL